MAADAYLRLEGLTRRFGEVTAVDDVTLSLAAGEILALLGLLAVPVLLPADRRVHHHFLFPIVDREQVGVMPLAGDIRVARLGRLRR